MTVADVECNCLLSSMTACFLVSILKKAVQNRENPFKIRMVAGASGGSKIISALAKTIVRTLVFGETVKVCGILSLFYSLVDQK